jgi:hypothetical protein
MLQGGPLTLLRADGGISHQVWHTEIAQKIVDMTIHWKALM